MATYLAVSSNVADPTPHLSAETARMAELQQAGLIDQMFLKADWSGVVLLMQTADEAAARAAVDSLPLVANGITTFTLTELINPPAGSPPQ